MTRYGWETFTSRGWFMEEDEFYADKMSLVMPKGWLHTEKLERGQDWLCEL